MVPVYVHWDDGTVYADNVMNPKDEEYMVNFTKNGVEKKEYFNI